MTRKDLLQLWYDAVWGKGDLDMIDKLFRPDTVAAGVLPEMQPGPQDLREVISAVRQLVGGITATLPICVEQGDRV